MSKSLFNEGLWVDLGRGIAFDGFPDDIKSLLWCIEMEQRVKPLSEGYDIAIRRATAIEHPLLRSALGMRSHCWINCSSKNEVFVADGTAGFIDARYSQGFYSNPANAIGYLAELYHGPSQSVRIIPYDSSDILPKMKLFSPTPVVHLSRR